MKKPAATRTITKPRPMVLSRISSPMLLRCAGLVRGALFAQLLVGGSETSCMTLPLRRQQRSEPCPRVLLCATFCCRFRELTTPHQVVPGRTDLQPDDG